GLRTPRSLLTAHHWYPARSGTETPPFGACRTARARSAPASPDRSRPGGGPGSASRPSSTGWPPWPAPHAPGGGPATSPRCCTPPLPPRRPARAPRRSELPSGSGPQRIEIPPRIVGDVPQRLGDAEQLVVLGHPVGAAGAAGLDLPRPARHREV